MAGKTPRKAKGASPQGTPVPAPARGGALLGLVFLGGVVTLCLEMTLVRLMAPYTGSTVYTWGAAITTIILCLALGNFLGAELVARRSDRLRTLGGCIVASTVYQALVPLWGPGFLEWVADNVFFYGSNQAKVALVQFTMAFLLAAPSLVALSATSPLVFAVLSPHEEHPGRLAGRVMGLGTLGSCVGVLAAVFLGVPLMGVKLTLWSLAGVTALGLLLVAGSRQLVVPAAVAWLLLGLGARGPLKTEITAQPGVLVLESAETPYTYAQVAEGGGFRYLTIGDGHVSYSKYDPSARLGYPYYTGSYWDLALVSPMLLPDIDVEKIMVRGYGAGISYQQFVDHYPGARVEAVEIDPVFLTWSREYFGVDPGEGTVHLGDARPVMRSLDGPYDVVMLDVYLQSNIPFYLLTEEFFGELKAKGSPHMLLAFNFAFPGKDQAFLNPVLAAVQTAFPNVYLVRLPKRSNIIVLASAGELDPGGAVPRAAQRWSPLGEKRLRYLTAVTAHVSTAKQAQIPQVTPFRDDFAPAELLGSRALNDFFQGRSELIEDLREEAAQRGS